VPVLQQGHSPGELRAAEFCEEGAAVGRVVGKGKGLPDVRMGIRDGEGMDRTMDLYHNCKEDPKTRASRLTVRRRMT